MPRSLVLPLLSHWQDFEDLCLDLWRRLWNAPDAQKHGRQGQPQAGVDVYGRPEGGREWAGVQCKLTERLTPEVVEEEVEKARTFEPALSRFVIATTARSDVHCQQAARKITDAGFPVTVVAWDEICHHLEHHPDLLETYFGIPRSEPRRAEPPPTGYRCMVALPPEGFVPREELDQIRDILCGEDTSTVGITSALRGAGGFGKTTLAQALCFDNRVRAAYPGGILWTTIGDQATEVDRLSRVLDLIRWWTRADPPHFDSVSAAAAHFRETLAGRRVLVVVDDAWSSADVEPFRGAGAGLLVTTRLRETLPAGCECVDVDAMRLEEALKLLMADLPGAEGLRPRFEAVARTLGEWPLLLKLVNRTLQELVREEGLGVEKALDEIGEALAAAGLEAFDQNDSSEREKAVSRTLEVSLRRLSGDERQKFKALAVFPEDEDVPLQIVECLWSCSAFEAKQLARRLHRLSLLLGLDAGTLRLHDVFRKYLIGRQGGDIAMLHQDLLARSGAASGRLAVSYLWRWLPYHMAHGGQIDTLRIVLLDFHFLAARLRATGVNVVIAGFDYVLGDPDLRMVQSAIRMSAHILVRHPEQLAGQLLGRLPQKSEGGKLQGWERLRQEAGAAGRELLLSGGAGLLPRQASLTPAGGPLLRTFEGDTGAVHAVAAVGEERALSGSADGTVRLWELETGACLRVFEGHTAVVHGATAVGQKWALSGSADNTMRLWDLETGVCLRVFEGHSGWVWAVAAFGEMRAISGSDDGTVRLWDLATGACLCTLEGHTGPVSAVAVVGQGRALSGSADGTIRLWDLAMGACVCTFRGHSDRITSVAAVGEGWALSGSLDRTARLWDLETGACRQVFEGHSRWLYAVGAVGERRGLSGSADGTVRLWDLTTGACLRTYKVKDSWILALAAVGVGRALSGSLEGRMYLWDLAMDPCLDSLKEDVGPIYAVAALGAGRALSASFDARMRLWDVAAGVCLRTFEGDTDPVYAVAALEVGQALSGSFGGSVCLWDVETGVCVRAFERHAGPVYALAVIGVERALSGSDDGTLRLWDVTTGACLRVFQGHSGKVLAVAAMGAQWALSGSEDCTVRLWDVATGTCLRTFEGHTGEVRAVAALGERRALSGSSDGTVRLWDLATGTCRGVFGGHVGWVTAVAAVGEERALSGSIDRLVRLWDLDSGVCLAVFPFDSRPNALAVSNGIVIVGDTGGNVHFLDLILPNSDPT